MTPLHVLYRAAALDAERLRATLELQRQELGRRIDQAYERGRIDGYLEGVLEREPGSDESNSASRA